MKLLVVSSYFGPESSVGVLRINAFVKYWTSMGHQVTVLTMPYSGELPEVLDKNSRLKVIQVAPWLLSRAQGEGPQSYSKGAQGWKRSVLRFQYWLKKKFLCNYLDPRILWWPRVVLKARELMRHGEVFDAVVSTAPSYTAHSAASMIKRLNPRMKWVADYRDLWFGNPIFPGCALVRTIERAHERFILSNADLLVSINEQLISELRETHGAYRRYLVIENGIEDAELNDAILAAKGERLAKNQRVQIIYAGSILPGLQDPTPLLAAVRELSHELQLAANAISISFYGDYSALDNFSLAKDPLVAKHVALCGKVPRDKALELQRNADFLLFLGSRPVSSNFGSTRGVVSGKVFEYLISGTEILAIGVTDDMLVADMIRKASVGTAYGSNVEQIKDRLRRALRGETAKVSPDFSYIGQFRRSGQARRLIEAIDQLEK